MKPVLQVHVYEPGVSTQVASELQGLVRHSLISENILKEINYIKHIVKNLDDLWHGFIQLSQYKNA